MHTTIYVTVVHKKSYRVDTKKTSERRNSYSGYSTVLTEFGSFIYWLCLCVGECSADRQCKWPSDGGTLL